MRVTPCMERFLQAWVPSKLLARHQHLFIRKASSLTPSSVQNPSAHPIDIPHSSHLHNPHSHLFATVPHSRMHLDAPKKPLKPKDITFTPQDLANFSRRLLARHELPRYKFQYDTTKVLREAAVLMPLCIVDGKPSVLFTSLNSHRGEVSFPGGKKDANDVSMLEVALRECEEEIGLPSSAIEILGQYATLPDRTRTTKVYPYIGFIKSPIPHNLGSITPNPQEVSHVFTLSIEQLLNPARRRERRFRNSEFKYPVFSTEGIRMKNENGTEECEVPEVWGLTSFILDGVLRTVINPSADSISTRHSSHDE